MFKLTTLAACALCIAAPASAVTISAYDTTNGVSVAAALTPADVTGADLVRGAGVQQTGNANNFRSNQWTLGGDLATAQLNNDYLEWGFSSTSTYSLDTLSLRYDRGGNGPQALAILASFDGGTFTQIFLDSFIDTASEIANIDLSAIDATSATFRLFAWDASRNGGGLFLRNNGVGPNNDFGIALTGDIAVVPVPATLPLLAGALGLFALVRRKA